MIYLLKERNLVCKRITNYVSLNVGITNNSTIFKIKGPLGNINFSYNNKSILFIKPLHKFFIRNLVFTTFQKRIIDGFRGVLVPWIQPFVINGYQYKVSFSYITHRFCIDLGFTYWMILDLNLHNKIHLKIIEGKNIRQISRRFVLSGVDVLEFSKLKKFFSNVRTLLPYKIKGFTPLNTQFKLKVGKRTNSR